MLKKKGICTNTLLFKLHTYNNKTELFRGVTKINLTQLSRGFEMSLF